MKWSEEKVELLKSLAFAGITNSEIARQLNAGISDVYAKRSQLGITIDKVKAVRAAAANPEPEAELSKVQPAMKKEQLAELQELCAPVAKFLKTHYDPYTAIVISKGRVHIVIDTAGFPIERTDKNAS
jgi:hypothetical protein